MGIVAKTLLHRQLLLAALFLMPRVMLAENDASTSGGTRRSTVRVIVGPVLLHDTEAFRDMTFVFFLGSERNAETVDIGSGWAIDLGLEYRFSDRFGLGGGLSQTSLNADYTLGVERFNPFEPDERARSGSGTLEDVHGRYRTDDSPNASTPHRLVCPSGVTAHTTVGPSVR